jgi:hypothetical protein
MRIKLFAAAVALAFAAPTWSLPATTVAWVQRTGTTTGTEAVEVWLRLTVTQLDAGPLALDGTSASFSALNFEQLSQRGFARIDKISNSGSVMCGGDATFFTQTPLRRCNDPTAAWSFQFNRGPNGFLADQAAPIEPGQSRDYLFATFTPQNGPVAPGTYALVVASLHIAVTGADAEGQPLGASLQLGATCGAGAADCAFTRVVTAVPEPQTYALMCLGLLTTVAAARRRAKQRAG